MNVTIRMIWLSVIASLLFALVGVIWGLYAKSSMILFDGVYSFISLALSLLSLGATSFIKKRDEKRFPYGKGMIEPIVLFVKHSALAILCAVAMVTALYDLFTGGRDVDPAQGFLYAILCVSGCAVVFFILKRKARTSPFIEAESRQWMMDTFLSVAVLAGFAAALLLTGTGYAFLVPYVDPFMVLVSASAFLIVPLKSLKDNGKELLEMAPAPDIQEVVRGSVEEAEASFSISESVIRLAKAGPTLFVDIDFILGPETEIRDVRDMDDMREKINRSLQDLPYDLWLTVTFTADRKWAT
ncbi:cation diffusion facilitator family transporter [Bacillus piscicola]|uniref:cation diffusion facilitator family transporter n=1 Tax=Bacillus piscicola TaxID=1632684 RepID=UPI001F094EC3|nr:cation transporter [Bacillus piscicola]